MGTVCPLASKLRRFFRVAGPETFACAAHNSAPSAALDFERKSAPYDVTPVRSQLKYGRIGVGAHIPRTRSYALPGDYLGNLPTSKTVKTAPRSSH